MISILNFPPQFALKLSMKEKTLFYDAHNGDRGELVAGTGNFFH